METDRHITLKRAALAHLINTGFNAAANEVRAPASRFLVDAAGYIDRRPMDPAGDARRPTHAERTLFDATPRSPRPRRMQPRTIIIECKQHRSDFLRDRKELPALLEERDRLEQRRLRIEERLKRERPDLRRSGTFLFDDLEAWDFDAVAYGGYRSTLRDLRRIDAHIHADTKFFLAAQHRLADRLFILAPRGMIGPPELPRAWGLLEASPALLRGRPPSVAELAARLARDPQLVMLRRRADDRHPRADRRARLLRNIAIRATRCAVADAPSPGNDTDGRAPRTPRCTRRPAMNTLASPSLFVGA